MKPNQNQLTICEFLTELIKTWKYEDELDEELVNGPSFFNLTKLNEILIKLHTLIRNSDSEFSRPLVLELVMDQLSFWKSTNDINSPTHMCDVSECLSSLWFDSIISEEEDFQLNEALGDLYYFIIKIN